MGLLESLDEHFSSRSSESGEGSFSERLRRVASSDAARWMAVAAVVVVVALGVFLRRDGRPVEDLLPRADQGTTDAETTRPDSAGDIDDPVATSAVEVGAEGSNGPLIVHVAGQVQVPGLVEVPAGSRVADAVTAAGGPAPFADLDRLNLAAPLADGQRVDVAAIGDPPDRGGVSGPPNGRGGGSGGSSGDTTGDDLIDVNNADVTDLEELPGVGPATAAAIIAHRDEHGPFASVEELIEVRGIGPAKLEAISERATVGP